MSTNTIDLWPADLGTPDVQTPVAILREQATLLGQKTNQLVQAEVKTRFSGGFFWHKFHLVAPALDNYRYELFSVHHDVDVFYPLQLVVSDRDVEVNSEEELLVQLRELFASETTKRVVQSLLSQSQE